MEQGLEQARQAYFSRDLNTALGILRGLHDRHPGHPETMLRLGQVHFRLGDHRSAQGLFQEVSRLDPDGLGPAAREGIAECLLIADQRQGSTQWLGGRLRFLLVSAQAYQAQGKPGDAVRCWRRVLSLEPENIEARRSLEAAAAEPVAPEPYGWVG